MTLTLEPPNQYMKENNSLHDNKPTFKQDWQLKQENVELKKEINVDSN